MEPEPLLFDEREISTVLKRAAEIDPHYPDPLFNLAQLAMTQDRLSEAEKYYRGFLSLAETGPLVAKAQKALQLIGLHKSA